MASLYMDTLRDGSYQPALVTSSLFELLTMPSSASCQVDGTRILRKSTPEWGEYLKARRAELLRGGLSEQNTERIIADLEKREISYVGTTFRATNYSGYTQKRLLYDTEGLLICEVSVEANQVDIFQGTKGQNKFVDWAKKARQDRQHYFYDGSVQEALAEFAQGGFRFNLWNTVWKVGGIENGKPTPDLAYTIPQDGVTLEDILRFAGQQRQ